MLDRVVRLNDKEALMIYTNRKPVKLSADNIDQFMGWVFDTKTQLTYTEHVSAVTGMTEDTAVINLKEAA